MHEYDPIQVALTRPNGRLFVQIVEPGTHDRLKQCLNNRMSDCFYVTYITTSPLV